MARELQQSMIKTAESRGVNLKTSQAGKTKRCFRATTNAKHNRIGVYVGDIS